MATVEGIKALGTLLRDARKARDWTQRDVSERTGLSVGYISNVEKGYVNPDRGPVVPSDDSLRALSRALEVPLPRLHRALGRGDTEEDPRLREAGIIYAAGWSELTERGKRAVLDLIETLVAEREEAQSHPSAPPAETTVAKDTKGGRIES